MKWLNRKARQTVQIATFLGSAPALTSRTLRDEEKISIAASPTPIVQPAQTVEAKLAEFAHYNRAEAAYHHRFEKQYAVALSSSGGWRQDGTLMKEHQKELREIHTRLTAGERRPPAFTMWLAECLNKKLTIDQIRKLERIDTAPEFLHADGWTLCKKCGKAYMFHPFSEHRSYNDEPYLRRLCEGTLVKL